VDFLWSFIVPTCPRFFRNRFSANRPLIHSNHVFDMVTLFLCRSLFFRDVLVLPFPGHIPSGLQLSYGKSSVAFFSRVPGLSFKEV